MGGGAWKGVLTVAVCTQWDRAVSGVSNSPLNACTPNGHSFLRQHVASVPTEESLKSWQLPGGTGPGLRLPLSPEVLLDAGTEWALHISEVTGICQEL